MHISCSPKNTDSAGNCHLYFSVKFRCLANFEILNPGTGEVLEGAMVEKKSVKGNERRKNEKN